MLTKSLFKKAFWFLALTGALNWFAYKLYLYWTVWWVDILAHFLGGVTVGFAVLWVYSFKKDFYKYNLGNFLKILLLWVFIVGFLWEVLEVYIKATSLSDGLPYWTDTISDLIMDIIGGILSAIYVFRTMKKYE